MATLHTRPAGRAASSSRVRRSGYSRCARRSSAAGGEQPLDAAYWAEQIALAASEGERVLGFAAKLTTTGQGRLSFADLDDGLLFLGVVGFIDPPRDDAIAAIAECRSAGISVKMITGDHAATAAAIARQLGMADAPEVINGTDSITSAMMRSRSWRRAPSVRAHQPGAQAAHRAGAAGERRGRGDDRRRRQ